jgi:hypothetical protein
MLICAYFKLGLVSSGGPIRSLCMKSSKPSSMKIQPLPHMLVVNFGWISLFVNVIQSEPVALWRLSGMDFTGTGFFSLVL